jgi:lauroyl/myristoyl acyltransferase
MSEQILNSDWMESTICSTATLMAKMNMTGTNVLVVIALGTVLVPMTIARFMGKGIGSIV